MAVKPALIVVEVEVGKLTEAKAAELVQKARVEIEPKLPPEIPSIFVHARDGKPSIKVSTLFA